MRMVVKGGNRKAKMKICYSGFDVDAALSPWDTIGSHGARNFTLCKKAENAKEAAVDDGRGPTAGLPRRGSGTLRSWLNRSLNLKIYSH